MYPIIHGLLLLGILSFSLLGLTACGEKRIHVATVSGAPGEESNSSLAKADTAGIPGTAVDESSLTGTNPSTEEIRADAVLPVAPVEPLHFAHEPSVPAKADESFMQEPEFSTDTPSEIEPGPALAEVADSSDPFIGQKIETQSGSSIPNGSPQDSAEGSPIAGSAASQNDQFSPQGDNSNSENFHQSAPQGDSNSISENFHQSAPQDDSTSIPENLQLSQAEPEAAFDNDELSPQIVEQIPDKVQLAKAEPSDILRQQLDKIKEEELATASAGLEDVFFQFDSWTLTAEAKESLERDMGWLTNEPSSSLIIEGHADQRGTQAYNMILGKKRAMAIRDYLSQLGVDPSRLSIISYGKDKPFCQDHTEVCHQLNRRGHLLVQN